MLIVGRKPERLCKSQAANVKFVNEISSFPTKVNVASIVESLRITHVNLGPSALSVTSRIKPMNSLELIP